MSKKQRDSLYAEVQKHQKSQESGGSGSTALTPPKEEPVCGGAAGEHTEEGLYWACPNTTFSLLMYFYFVVCSARKAALSDIIQEETEFIHSCITGEFGILVQSNAEPFDCHWRPC